MNSGRSSPSTSPPSMSPAFGGQLNIRSRRMLSFGAVTWMAGGNGVVVGMAGAFAVCSTSRMARCLTRTLRPERPEARMTSCTVVWMADRRTWRGRSAARMNGCLARFAVVRMAGSGGGRRAVAMVRMSSAVCSAAS